MFDEVPRENAKTIALLCIGDVSPADGEVALSLTPLFGQPMIHHMIKALQKIGITQFCVGVDSVPGALLTYRDAIAQEGLDLRFVREPSSMAALLATDMQVLVLRADTIWDVDLIERALLQKRPLIATVEERAENQIYERIDLNSRWSGMAILDRGTLDGLTQLPEGWDMGSALLRQAMQDGITLWPLKQSEIQDGRVRRMENTADLATAQGAMIALPKSSSKTLESKLFSKSFARFAPKIWTVPWGRGLAEFSFPGLSFLAATLAFFGFPLGASLTATIAVLSSLIRNIVRHAEHRSGADFTGISGWMLLTAALLAVLYLNETSFFEAGFLGLTLAGLSLVSAKRNDDESYRLLSPLVVGIALIAGTCVGGPAWAVKLLILSEVILQFLRALGWLQNRAPED